MSTPSTTTSASQGFGPEAGERMPPLASDRMTPEQRAAADALIAGPRKAVFGPFVPLLRNPALMDRVGALGETLRYKGTLPDALRELAICIAARHVSNQFEWLMHKPLAAKAGVASVALDAIGAGRQPRGLSPEQATVAEFAQELLLRNGVSDATYAEATALLGDGGVVELVTLVGYFVMVSWVMNVARTPGTLNGNAPIAGFPS